MRIDRIELHLVPLRLRERFEISSGGRQDRVIFLVTLHGEGQVGWGECVAGEDPGYSYETTETAWHLLRDLIAPAVVGTEPGDPASVLDPVAWIRGHRMAKAAVEMAAWDLDAHLRGIPLASAIGGEIRDIPVGVSVGLQPTDAELVAKVEAYLALGYRRIKVKVKPGRDVAMLAAVREAFPDAALMADANSAYRLSDAEHLAGFDDLGLMMIEQPLGHEDLLDHARLQERLTTPICLDESIRSVADTRLALELGATRIVNIKPGRVGGFGPAQAIHELSRGRGVPVWCGGMLESGIGRAHNLALASLPGFTLPGDISASSRYWEEDLVEPEFVLADGALRLPDAPGIGVRPRVERIERLRSRHEVIR